MAKFIDKKEQVYDLKLTSYGHYLLSTGRFKPEYYAFFDSNIIYDGSYARMTETQNDISNRIKNETQYIESLVLFEDVENHLKNSFVDGADPTTERYFSVDVTPTMIKPRLDAFRFTSIIGDAHLDADQQKAPAWKLVSLNGEIMSSSLDDKKNQVDIPQVNINLNYRLSVERSSMSAGYTETGLRNATSITKTFSDGNVIKLSADDLLMYAEELNTDILNENFDVEVFEIEHDAVAATCETCTTTDRLIRKYFPEDPERILGGLMSEKTQVDSTDPYYGSVSHTAARAITSGSVEYYFDFIKDTQINPLLACRAAEIFNKQSYYVSLDFDCDSQRTGPSDQRYYDIYGPTTVPEVCS
jgi:hypothetical protein